MEVKKDLDLAKEVATASPKMQALSPSIQGVILSIYKYLQIDNRASLSESKILRVNLADGLKEATQVLNNEVQAILDNEEMCRLFAFESKKLATIKLE